MARDKSPIVKQSRREGFALAPKAHKIMARKSGIPGQHSDMRIRGGSLYLTQLREKQKVRRLYGLLEKQFAKLMKEALKTEGLSGQNLLEFLERRADNVIFRAGFATTRRQARQLVSHGHFLLNGRRIDIPSIRLKAGDVLEVRTKSAKSEYFKNLENTVAASGVQPLSWLKADAKKMRIEITGTPKREEVEAGINEQLIVEYYSR
jgi:ribosomal protein S4